MEILEARVTEEANEISVEDGTVCSVSVLVFNDYHPVDSIERI